MTVTLVLSVSISGAAQQGTGSVCVAARIDDPFVKEPATLPNGEINSHGLKVRVDRRPVEEWPQRKSLKIDGLDTSERHLLVVLDSSGKPIESVRFRFSDYKSTDLCMSYDGYQGIGLQEATRKNALVQVPLKNSWRDRMPDAIANLVNSAYFSSSG